MGWVVYKLVLVMEDVLVLWDIRIVIGLLNIWFIEVMVVILLLVCGGK